MKPVFASCLSGPEPNFDDGQRPTKRRRTDGVPHNTSFTWNYSQIDLGSREYALAENASCLDQFNSCSLFTNESSSSTSGPCGPYEQNWVASTPPNDLMIQSIGFPDCLGDVSTVTYNDTVDINLGTSTHDLLVEPMVESRYTQPPRPVNEWNASKVSHGAHSPPNSARTYQVCYGQASNHYPIDIFADRLTLRTRSS